MRRKIRKVLWFSVAGAIILLLAWRLFVHLSVTENKNKKAFSVAVETAPVVRKNIKDIRVFSGTVFSDSAFTVSSKITGCVKEIFFNIGDKVLKGAVIASLDDDEYVLEVERAKAELDVAKATQDECRSSLEIKKRELERAGLLHQKNVLSQAELDKSIVEYKGWEAKDRVASALVNLRKSSLDAAEVKLGYTKIKAQWGGGGEVRYVGERFVNDGTLLSPNSPIVTLVDLDSIKAVIHVIERDISSVKIGQEAKIYTDAYPDRFFKGKVYRIAPVLSERTRTADVEIEIDNKDHLLKPGMFALAELEFSKSDNASVVPVQALARREGKSGVFLVDEKTMKVSYVPVETGIYYKNELEILSPDISGMVVTLGHHLLENGTAVTLPEKETAKAAAK